MGLSKAEKSQAKMFHKNARKWHRQRHVFALSYSQHFDAERAAEEAGYKPGYASTVLRHPAVQAAIDRHLEARGQAVRRSTVLAGLLKEANDHGPGASHSARVSAWTTLAKILGITTERHVHTFEWVQTLGMEDIRRLEALEDTKLLRALEARELPAPNGTDDAEPSPPLLET